MMPNCTLALYAALVCCEVGPEDEVIVPAFTMAATAFAVRMAGATPVLADVAEDSLCLSGWGVSKAETERTKTILSVALNGRAEYGLYLSARLDASPSLIEDAAQAFGSRFTTDTFVGTLGLAGCYSFSPHKIISTGQGGCAVINDDDVADRIRHFRDFGRPTSGGYEHDTFGTNLKFTDLQAVVGLEQMKKMPWRVQRKRELYALYREALEDIPQVRFVPTDLSETVPWYVDILVDDRDELAAYLKEKDVGTRPFYPPLHRLKAFSDYKHLSFPVAERVSEEGLWLPSSVTLTNEQVYYVCDQIREYYQ